jgi:hypothetical protein
MGKAVQDGSPAWTYRRPSIGRRTFKGVQLEASRSGKRRGELLAAEWAGTGPGVPSPKNQGRCLPTKTPRGVELWSGRSYPALGSRVTCHSVSFIQSPSRGRGDSGEPPYSIGPALAPTCHSARMLHCGGSTTSLSSVLDTWLSVRRELLYCTCSDLKYHLLFHLKCDCFTAM